MEKMIKVTGNGRMSVKPDHIRLYMSLETQGEKYDDVLKQATERTASLQKAFADAGFATEDLKTLYFNVNTVNEGYQDEEGNWKNRLKGYCASQRIKLEFANKNEILGKALCAAANSELQPEISVEYYIADEEALKDKLLTLAVEDAKQKAQVLANAANTKLGGIVSMEYLPVENAFGVRPVSAFALAKRSDRLANGLGMEAELIEVKEAVTVIFEIG